MDTLSQYLRRRGIVLEPLKLGEDRKLTDEAINAIASIPEEGLVVLLEQRIVAIQDEMFDNAIPEEIPVLRQAMVEMGGLIDDYNRAKEELKRRKTQNTPEETQPSPPVKAGEEGSI